MSSRTNVTVEIRWDGGCKFVGVVKSAKTGRQMFETSPKVNKNLALFAAGEVIVDRKWNEVTA